MILDDIVEHKKKELRKSMLEIPLSQLEKGLEELPAPIDFYSIAARDGSLKIISEVKKASPSRGVICNDFDPVKIAKSYEANGASAISVLTDEKFFQGSLNYLSEIRKEVSIPLLRKDFTIDPYHIYEARLSGADMVLLIVAILDKSRVAEYLDIADSLNLNAIVEVHNAEELETALDAGSGIVGINNRDLRDFKVSLDTSVELIKYIPDDVVVISESGISNPEDIRMLRKLGINTFLIGESFMKSPDPGVKLREYIDQIELNS